ncbi:MAG: glycoside hydrolase family 55 protein [Hyphomicrobium sp.]
MSSPAVIAGSCTGKGYPLDARVFNVRAFGAKGDGITDDTAAIQRALSDAQQTEKDIAHQGVIRVVYMPHGTYRISDTLRWRTSYERYLVLQGQSRDGTIIKLDNAASGFANPAEPKAVISTLRAKPNLRDSFRNVLRDVTIDAGISNPGAVGLDYMSNNTGGITDVTIKAGEGAGIVGLRLTQEAHGPSLIKNLTIDGFETGIEAEHDEFNAVFEDLTLNGQKKRGIRNRQFLLTIRNLISNNTVPVVSNEGNASLVQIVGGRLTGGAASETAISSEAGVLHLRQLSLSGYGVSVSDRDRLESRATIDEYTTVPFRGGGKASLGLPVKDVPEIHCEDANYWTSIEAFGAISNDGGKPVYSGTWQNQGDDAAAIQAAIDSGSTTIYFPNGIWQIGRTIHVRGNVRRLMLSYSTLQLTAALASSGAPVFRFEDGREHAVVIEQFETDYGPASGTFLEHASGRTLVLREAAVNFTQSAPAYTTAAGGSGDVFFEDVTLNPVQITRQSAWFRQFNAEGSGATHLINDGGEVFVLGMKTEGVAGIAETRNGGKTEILGALLASSDHVPADLAGITNNGSSVSVVAATGIDPAAQQDLAVRAITAGMVYDLRSADFLPRAPSAFYPWNGSYGPSGAFWLYASP